MTTVARWLPVAPIAAATARPRQHSLTHTHKTWQCHRFPQVKIFAFFSNRIPYLRKLSRPPHPPCCVSLMWIVWHGTAHPKVSGACHPLKNLMGCNGCGGTQIISHLGPRLRTTAVCVHWHRSEEKSEPKTLWLVFFHTTTTTTHTIVCVKSTL